MQSVYLVSRIQDVNGVKVKEYVIQDGSTCAWSTEQKARDYLKSGGYDEEKMKEEQISFEQGIIDETTKTLIEIEGRKVNESTTAL